MDDPAPHFDDAGRLIAPQFDDVYFSAEDGLAETEHVFLAGNRLAERLAALQPGEHFTIGETGFGTGLNFLAAWHLFEQHAPPDAQLEFVSVEGFPLDIETMQQALSPWPALAVQREALVQQWGPIWPGMHRFRFAHARVRLTLLVGDVADVLAECDACVDAWFLDGFAPSRNEAMWSKAVFKQVARLSVNDATLATYTAAGFVRRGLQAVGFEIEKQPGFGTKRDMTVGRLKNEINPQTRGGHTCLPSDKARSAIVIGASLAGAFVARSLAERGVTVTVIEQQAVVDGELPSLSPRVAVLQPKISDKDDSGGRWLRDGYAIAERWLRTDVTLSQAARWQACGTFQAAVDPRSERRLHRFLDQFGDTGLCRWIDATQTNAELGVALPVGGVIIEHAGVLRPAGLCKALLNHPLIRTQDQSSASSLKRDGANWTIERSADKHITSDTVIVANALSAQALAPTRHLKLEPVRGQVTLLDADAQGGQTRPLNALRCPIFYGGYALPVFDGVQTIGASFVPGDTELAWRDSEHAQVCDKLAKVLPDEAERLRGIDHPTGWVGLRTTTAKHRCYAEQIEPGLYVSLGHGSHGIASAAHAGEHLAALITGGARSTR